MNVRSKPETLESFLAMPIFKHNDVIGVFNISSTKAYALSEKDIQTLQPFCSLLSFALDLRSQTPQTNLVDVIKRFREKQILVLGKDDGPEIERLHAIRDCVHSAGYQPLLVKDYPDIPELSNEEKVRVFADASRFVILENTFPAGQIAELKMCATNRIVTAALRERGKGSSFMVTDYFKDFDFIKEFEYRDPGSLNPAVESALKWVNKKSKNAQNTTMISIRGAV